MPALAGLPIAETRSCQRPYSPDLLPLLGPYPGADGLILATGHGSVGVTLSLGSGEVVADGIAERPLGPRAGPGARADLTPGTPRPSHSRSEIPVFAGRNGRSRTW